MSRYLKFLDEVRSSLFVLIIIIEKVLTGPEKVLEAPGSNNRTWKLWDRSLSLQKIKYSESMSQGASLMRTQKYLI